MTAILLAGLTIFSCKTTGTANPQETLALLRPPVPEVPEMERVVFEDRDGGLWLSYDDYRALERNVIALREYAARLEIIIGFYREE
jgi:hypothetical protein